MQVRHLAPVSRARPHRGRPAHPVITGVVAVVPHARRPEPSRAGLPGVCGPRCAPEPDSTARISSPPEENADASTVAGPDEHEQDQYLTSYRSEME